jgi:hypothetical protein
LSDPSQMLCRVFRSNAVGRRDKDERMPPGICFDVRHFHFSPFWNCFYIANAFVWREIFAGDVSLLVQLIVTKIALLDSTTNTLPR